MQARASLWERIQSTTSSVVSAAWQGTKQAVSFIWKNKFKIAVIGVGVYVARNYSVGSPGKSSLLIEGDGVLPNTDSLVQNRLQQAKLASRTMSLPFTDEPIISSEHDGLSFDYDSSVSSFEEKAPGVVCDLSGIYKGWIERTEGTDVLSSPTVGGSHRMYLLSNKPQRPLEIDKQTSMVHVGKRAGNITIKAIQNNNDLSTPKASCSRIR